MLRLNDFSSIEDELIGDISDEKARINPKMSENEGKSASIAGSISSFGFPFFGSKAPRNSLSIGLSETIRVNSDESVKKRKARVRDSPLLPRWLRAALFQLVGIKRHEHDRPLLSLFFYVATITSAVAFLITDVWYQIFSIISVKTNQDVLSGSVQMLLSLFFVQLGPISFQLAFKLYSCPVLVESVRLHAKSVFGLNAAILLVLLATLFAGNNLFGVWYQLDDSFCAVVALDVALCKVRFVARIVYTALMFFWNVIVGMIVLSVCRSHTLGIRKFIRDLEDDGGRVEALWKKSSAARARKRDDDAAAKPVNETVSAVGLSEASKDLTSTQSESTECCLSVDAILADYRKITARLRLTGFLMQRWIASWIAFVLLWCGNYLIYWMRNEASVGGIFDFLLPLFLLPLIISSVAEVNAEGQRALRYLAPTEERIPLIWFMQSNPLQLTIYGFRLDYSAELKVIAAVAIGFGSQIILREFLRD